MRTLTLVVAIAWVGFQAQPPDTEVFLAKLTISGNTITVGPAENISNAPGYDNQPSFTPTGDAVFFTSARGGAPQGATEPQMDIYRYDIASKQMTQVTRTPESEYSATVTPDGRHVSVIRVEADKTQRLWKFPLAGGEPSLVLTDIKPVGYHAWLDANTLALFVLGQPATLQIADVRTGKAEIAASEIGRSLLPIPGGGVSFVQRTGQGAQRVMTISRVRVANGKPETTAITNGPPDATDEYVAWTPDGTLLMAAGGHLMAWREGEKEWRRVADLGALGLKGVSRLAVSPKGNWIAFVAAK
jgi:dipeptidyl aminopeptidase/acylaminoacyl peptidase